MLMWIIRIYQIIVNLVAWDELAFVQIPDNTCVVVKRVSYKLASSFIAI